MYRYSVVSAHRNVGVLNARTTHTDTHKHMSERYKRVRRSTSWGNGTVITQYFRLWVPPRQRLIPVAL